MGKIFINYKGDSLTFEEFTTTYPLAFTESRIQNQFMFKFRELRKVEGTHTIFLDLFGNMINIITI